MTNPSPPVAPLAGAWIEMGNVQKDSLFIFVAPLAGAWIEIHTAKLTRERL